MKQVLLGKVQKCSLPLRKNLIQWESLKIKWDYRLRGLSVSKEEIDRVLADVARAVQLYYGIP